MDRKLNDFYSDIDEKKIWNDIMTRLDPGDAAEPENDIFEEYSPHEKKNFIKYVPMLSAAAVVILIIVSLNTPSVMYETDDIVQPIFDEAVNEAAEQPASAEEASEEAAEDTAASDEIFFPAESGWQYASVSVSSAESYSYYDFSDTAAPYYEDNSSDDFFVEADVLENTDFFLDCTVGRAEYDPDTETVTYTVSPIHVICPESISLPYELEITSGRAYVLGEGNEYLLPIAVSFDGRYYIADSSAPQIELTGDGYVLFQNGWKTLADGDEQYLWKDSSSPDDFFYDRMNITAESKLQNLFDKFLEK
ncbi:MAG: hypothetical protein ACI4J5_08200 [Oscillospiraceae bacterium]